MARTSTVTHQAPVANHATQTNTVQRGSSAEPGRSGGTRSGQNAGAAHRFLSDDEILGLTVDKRRNVKSAEGDVSSAQREFDFDGAPDASEDSSVESSADRASKSSRRVADVNANAEPEHLRAAFDAHPELRCAWQEAEAYRQTFRTPEEAEAATALLADLDHLDALFFSRRPEDHAELARVIASLDPAAFSSLAQAMSGLATEAHWHKENEASRQGSKEARNPGVGSDAMARPMGETSRSTFAGHGSAVPLQQTDAVGAEPMPSSGLPSREVQTKTEQPDPAASPGHTAAQAEFFHATNAAAVQSVLDAIESQVERLLPEGVSKSARNRVVGEIYRELDATLQSNQQLAAQLRDAFRAGGLDANHQRAVVSLIAGRARQALPAVAKRVLNEWTSTVIAASHDRRARQRAAERRVDIAGSGGAANDGRRSLTPRDIDYGRLSDADILNL